MLVHKCDTCGKIFKISTAAKREYRITKSRQSQLINDSHTTEEVDICDDCYLAVVEFLEGGTSSET